MTNNFEEPNQESENKSDDSMVDAAKELGGELRNISRTKDPADGVAVDTTPDGKEFYIDEDGNRYDKDGNLIQEGQKEY